ncbi:MAG: hypothetical protein ACXVI9_09050 [Mucilaginibacter sp.]
MKSFLIVCVLISLGSLSFAQTKERIPIPVLKESKRIDQLMDMVLSPNNQKVHSVTNYAAGTCFMITMDKIQDNYFTFEINKHTDTVTNTLINGMEVEKDYFGYFTYKKCKIFVWADAGFGNFFSKTGTKTTFDFVYLLGHPDSLGPAYTLAQWHYQYKDGHFSVEQIRVMPPGEN